MRYRRMSAAHSRAPTTLTGLPGRPRQRPGSTDRFRASAVSMDRTGTTCGKTGGALMNITGAKSDPALHPTALAPTRGRGRILACGFFRRS
jgi:hypothetical protein